MSKATQLPSLIVLLWDFIENGESSYGLSFSDLRGRVREEGPIWEYEYQMVLDLQAGKSRLGAALRALLPYAENEIAYINLSNNGTEEDQGEADAASLALAEAEAAISQTKGTQP